MRELMMLAILPGILIIIYIFKKDKVESEPVGLIIKLLILGVLSTVAAIIAETFITNRGPMLMEGTWSYALFNSFIVAALCEELCKYAALFIGSWNNREFNYRFDGIVYGVAVAVGFATIENIMYVFTYGFQTGLVRAVMSVPIHAFCGVFMGIFYGASKACQVKGEAGKMKNLILCVAVPIIVHGIYDTLAFAKASWTTAAILAFVVLLYIVSIKYIRKFSREDRQNGFYRHSEQNYGDSQAGPAYDFNLSGHGTSQGQPRYYGPAPGTPGAPAVKTTNGFSIAGFICGIIGLLSMGVFLLPSIAAVILGIIGKKRTPAQLKNAISIASILVGIIGLVIGGVMYVYVLFI